jgi:sec-independent protein translocase protein TatA
MRPGLIQLLICIAVIALLFGANKIPEFARALGKAKGEFKKGLKAGEAEDEEQPGTSEND